MQRPATLLVLLFLGIVHLSSAQNNQDYNYPQLDSIAQSFYRSGKYAYAIPYLTIAREKARTEFGELDSTYSLYTSNLGVFHYFIGKYEHSERLYKEVLAIDFRLWGQWSSNYAVSLNNLATLYRVMGKYEEAETYCLKAKQLKVKALGKRNPSYASSLNALGTLYLDMGKYEQAEPLYLEAKKIYADSFGKEHRQYTIMLNNLAVLYYKMGNFPKAETLYLQALEIKRRLYGTSHPRYANALSNLATFFKEQGNYKKAELYYLQVKDIFAKTVGQQHPSYATTLDNIANTYVKINRHKEALALYLTVKEIRFTSVGKQHYSSLSILNHLGSIYAALGQFDQAHHAFQEAIFHNSKSSKLDTTALLHHLSGLAQNKFSYNEEIIGSLSGIHALCYQQYKRTNDKKHLQIAYAAIQEALILNDRIRHQLHGEKDKLRTLNQTSILAEQAISLGNQLGGTHSEIYLQNSFYFAEQNKSVLLAEALKGQRAKVLSDVPDSLILKGFELQKRLKKIQKKALQVRGDSAKQMVQVNKNNLNEETTLFLKELKKNYPKYHQLKYENNTVQASDIQHLLNSKTVLLEYFVADTITYLFAIDHHQISIHPIVIKKEALKRIITRMRKALSDYTFITKNKEKAFKLFSKEAHRLYQLLLEKALQNRMVENIIIVTDGELGHLPFETFLVTPASQSNDEYTNLHYLINDYNISYNYSATLWSENKKAAPRSNSGKMLACSALYNTDNDSSITTLREEHIANLRSLLEPLPEAQKEIEVLSKQFEGDFLYGNASNEAFFKQNAADYNIIHLAMHGLLHARVPMLSSLAFTDNLDSIEDNFLQAYEIGHLKLNASLVVLSACETGFGKFEQGEGVVSLARSFMYAGVPSLVVSLWQVNDYSTSIIMQQFYQNLDQGQSKDVALRQAKLDYIKNSVGITAHPAFWSSFIQVGNAQPIDIARKKSPHLWGIGAGLFLLLIVGGFILKKRTKEI